MLGPIQGIWPNTVYYGIGQASHANCKSIPNSDLRAEKICFGVRMRMQSEGREECLNTISSPNFYRNMERPVLAMSDVYIFLAEAPYLQNPFAMTIHVDILVLGFRRWKIFVLRRTLINAPRRSTLTSPAHRGCAPCTSCTNNLKF